MIMPVKLLKQYNLGGKHMKRINRLLAVFFALFVLFQGNVVALADNEPDWQDAVWTQEEFNDILSQNPNNQISTRASGLILTYAIGVSGSGSNLLIAGNTICAPDVVKSGFTVVTIHRRKSSTTSWSKYKTYEDLYRKAPSYTLTKTIAVATGYQYRVTCTHYAKKSLFSTQKISNTSNVVAIG